MNPLIRVVLMATLLVLCSQGSFAIEPAYAGPMGNPEEPALRPYKWMWHGLKSFVHQPVRAIDQGNRKTPGLGTIEVVRGFRRGAVESAESAFRGSMFSRPPDAGRYKNLGKANAAIERDPFLRNATELFVGKVIDSHPMTPQDAREAIEDRIQEAREARRNALASAPRITSDPVEMAQRRYVSDRVRPNRKSGPVRNLLKYSPRGERWHIDHGSGPHFPRPPRMNLR